jgi:recombination protein RecT
MSDNTTGAPIAKRELSPLDKAVAQLSSEAMKRQFATACPTHLKNNAERYVRQFCTQIRMNPKLLQCDYGSLLGAMLTGTALGLDPAPALGEFYLIPYGKECQFQLGYRGMLALAYRGGVKQFSAHAVHEKDDFDYGLGLDPYIKHKPYLAGDRGAVIAYYATAKLPSGDSVFQIMSKPDVEAHARKYSKAASNGPWKTEFDEMAKKTVAKALFKWIPKSTELALAISKDSGITKMEKEITSQDEVIEAEVRYPTEVDEPTPNSLEAELKRQSAQKLPAPAAAPAPTTDVPTPVQEEDTSDILPFDISDAEKVAMKKVGTELEKMRATLMEGLAINNTDAESEAWIKKNFDGKTLKELTKDDLRAANAKLSTELDAKES